MTQWIFSGLTGFALSLLMGPMLLPQLKKWKFGQTIRDEGPERHMEKSGTPTMGGILFIAGSVVAVLIFAPMDVRLAIFLISLLGLLGVFFGGFIYSELYPFFKETLFTIGDLGKPTIPQALGINHWFIIIPMIVLVALAFRWLEKKGL